MKGAQGTKRYVYYQGVSSSHEITRRGSSDVEQTYTDFTKVPKTCEKSPLRSPMQLTTPAFNGLPLPVGTMGNNDDGLTEQTMYVHSTGDNPFTEVLDQEPWPIPPEVSPPLGPIPVHYNTPFDWWNGHDTHPGDVGPT
jgi:hypothetical protein